MVLDAVAVVAVVEVLAPSGINIRKFEVAQIIRDTAVRCFLLCS